MQIPLQDITDIRRPGQANPGRSQSLASIHRRGSHAAASLSVDPVADRSFAFSHSAKDTSHG